MNDEIIYFQLNNWFAGDHYPAEEPFISWCGNDFKLQFYFITTVESSQLAEACRFQSLC